MITVAANPVSNSTSIPSNLPSTHAFYLFFFKKKRLIHFNFKINKK